MLKLMREKYQFILFLFIGGVNTLFSYLILVLLLHFNLSYPVALLIATIAGILFNFKTTGGIVFGSQEAKLIFKFVLVYAVTYFFNILFFHEVKAMITNIYVLSALATFLSAFLAFYLNKRFVFNRKIS